MSFKQKLLNVLLVHPKLAVFAIGLAITMAVGTAIGTLDHNHLASAISQSSTVTGGFN
ncbi:hypothetical protein [Candidatus Nitrosocosmicus sp. R]